jgi:hypothetical protein
MPVWALTERARPGLCPLQGLRQQAAEEIALAFGVPTKKIMVSWLASLNYMRNVAAHHARLFNRKLQHAPGRPKKGQVPPLDHLRDEETAKGVFGTCNALAVIAYLLVDRGRDGLVPTTRRPAAGVSGVARACRPTRWASRGLGVARSLAAMTERREVGQSISPSRIRLHLGRLLPSSASTSSPAPSGPARRAARGVLATPDAGAARPGRRSYAEAEGRAPQDAASPPRALRTTGRRGASVRGRRSPRPRPR